MNIEEMTYKQFSDWCNDRACDGRWSMLNAIACIRMHDEVESAVEGKLFKRKARKKSIGKFKG